MSWRFIELTLVMLCYLQTNLPDTSFNCSKNSFALVSACELVSMFDSNSKSVSLNVLTLHKFFFNCTTNLFR